jgi:hypothetical protein
MILEEPLTTVELLQKLRKSFRFSGILPFLFLPIHLIFLIHTLHQYNFTSLSLNLYTI